MADIRRLQLGQVVDFVIAFNERQERAEKTEKKKPKKRLATQAEIDAYFG